MTKDKMKCPLCKGKGEMSAPRRAEDKPSKYDMARVLVKAGYSYREVADALGYKSIRSVSIAMGK